MTKFPFLLPTPPLGCCVDNGLWVAEHASRETGCGHASGPGRCDWCWAWDNSCRNRGRGCILDRVSRSSQTGFSHELDTECERKQATILS